MSEIKQELGKRLTVDEVAKFLGMTKKPLEKIMTS